MKQKRLISILLIVIALGGGWLLSGYGNALATSLDSIQQDAENSDDPLSSYRDALEQIREESKNLQSQIDEKKNLISGLQSDISSIDEQLVIVGAQLAAAETAISELETQIAECEANLEETEKKRVQRQAYLEERIVDYYIYGDINILDVIFGTDSFQDFVTTIDMVQTIIDNDKEMVTQLVAELEAIEQYKAELEQEKEDLTIVRNEYYDMNSDLKRLEAEKIAAIDEANWTLNEYLAYEKSLSDTAEAVTNTIRELMETSDSTLSYGGSMIWPLPSPWDRSWVTSDYGWRTHPIYGTTLFHTGIDIGADGGTPIYAAADGKVILREYYGGYGNCIMIDHGDGVVSLYAHMSAYGGFEVGDHIFSGEVLGYVGTTGTSNGNHLHFEVRLNGEHTSPWNYLN